MSSIFTKIINGEIPCHKIAENEALQQQITQLKAEQERAAQAAAQVAAREQQERDRIAAQQVQKQ